MIDGAVTISQGTSLSLYSSQSKHPLRTELIYRPQRFAAKPDLRYARSSGKRNEIWTRLLLLRWRWQSALVRLRYLLTMDLPRNNAKERTRKGPQTERSAMGFT